MHLHKTGSNHRRAKKFSYKNGIYTAKELAAMAQISADAMRVRITRFNGNIEKAMAVRQQKEFKINGVSGTLTEISRTLGINYDKLRFAVKQIQNSSPHKKTEFKINFNQDDDFAIATNAEAWCELTADQREIMTEFERIGTTARWE